LERAKKAMGIAAENGCRCRSAELTRQKRPGSMARHQDMRAWPRGVGWHGDCELRMERSDDRRAAANGGDDARRFVAVCRCAVALANIDIGPGMARSLNVSACFRKFARGQDISGSRGVEHGVAGVAGSIDGRKQLSSIDEGCIAQRLQGCCAERRWENRC